MSKEIILTNVRIAYAHGLWKARAFDKGKDPKFSCQFVFSKTDALVKQVTEAIRAVAKEEWSEKSERVIESLKGTDFLCLRDGDKQVEREELQGMVYIAASSRERPAVFDRNRNIKLTEQDGRPYSGCYVNAKIDIFPWEYEGKKMVLAELLGVQFVGDGDAWTSGGTCSPDDFPDLSAEDSAGGSDDLI